MSPFIGLIAGSIRPGGGPVRVAGAATTGLPPYRVAQRGVIRTFQTASVFPRLTVLENLMLGARPGRGESIVGALCRRRSWRHEEQRVARRGRALLDSPGLRQDEDRYAAALSGGQPCVGDIAPA